MSMQNYLKKASKKLVEDPDAAPDAEGEQHSSQLPQKPNTQKQGKTGGSAMHGAQPMAKKGTRKKI